MQEGRSPDTSLAWTADGFATGEELSVLRSDQVQPVLGRMVLHQVLIQTEFLVGEQGSNLDHRFTDFVDLAHLFAVSRLNDCDLDAGNIEEKVPGLPLASQSSTHDDYIVLYCSHGFAHCGGNSQTMRGGTSASKHAVAVAANWLLPHQELRS